MRRSSHYLAVVGYLAGYHLVVGVDSRRHLVVVLVQVSLSCLPLFYVVPRWTLLYDTPGGWWGPAVGCA